MKTILLTFMILMFSVALNAQVPEKKKETKSKSTSSGGAQERAINQAGVSVKTKSQTKSSSKTTSTPPTDDKKKAEETKKEEKKPQ